MSRRRNGTFLTFDGREVVGARHPIDHAAKCLACYTDLDPEGFTPEMMALPQGLRCEDCGSTWDRDTGWVKIPVLELMGEAVAEGET